MTSAEIRQRFLDFFASKGHTIVPSAPVVIKNDPTLLFTNAGMNQFKDYFLGNKPAPWSRVADTQKCLRVSGKHNDLEEVGVDTYHHTLFEMLGNWSFGDPARPAGGYFKAEAIAWSWELLTEVYGIDKEKLYVTIFEGDEKEGLPADEEALNEWKKCLMGSGFSEAEISKRIIPAKKKDNFWEMGDTGPCGPCTEIHVDCRTEAERSEVDGSQLVNADHPQVIEIWNNVFIQFNRKKDGSLEHLPAKHVDTGMGFERLVRVLQGKQSNYDTDVFTGTIAATAQMVKKEYGFSDSKQDIAFRVIADHIRAIAFTIADGQLPSNTGAGYVIRRILRRAVRYYYSYLDYKQPLLFQLLPVIAIQFESVFPELKHQEEFVGKVIKEEEEAFLRTIGKGLKIFEFIKELLESPADAMADKVAGNLGVEFLPSDILSIRQHKIISGRIAFILSDTHGFPLDLTKLIALESELAIDEAGFDSAMAEQKNRSRAATAIDAGDWVVHSNVVGGFVGYKQDEVFTQIARYRTVKAKGKEIYQFVLWETPFYAESGGQVGDTGTIEFNGEVIRVLDTKKENDLIIHSLEKFPSLIKDNYVTAKIDGDRRNRIRKHHSATHLLHAALRTVLGTHVAQKGSLVNEEHLRFDFSHFAKVTDEELEQIEALVNDKVRANIPVVIKEMPKDEALQLGAMALFGEKYGDTVRVVIMDPEYSVELCGGTHVGHTGDIGFFKIKHETAVAAGVRRLEAVAGKAAEHFIRQQLDELHSIRALLKSPKDVAKAIENLQADNSALQRHIDHLEARQLVIVRNELLQKDEIINQVNFIGDIVEVSSADALKKLCYDLKNHLNDFVVVLCANIGGKPFIAVSIADTVVAARQLDAGKIIKEHLAPLIKGGGGGQKNLATAGGQDASNLQVVIDKVRSIL